MICRSPSATRSTTDAQRASDQPLDLLRCGRPACRRRPRVGCACEVARGSMPYSAVTQPRPWPLSQGGSRSSRLAVHRHVGIAEISPRHEPSAYYPSPRSAERCARSSNCGPLGHISRGLSSIAHAVTIRRLTNSGGDGRSQLYLELDDIASHDVPDQFDASEPRLADSSGRGFSARIVEAL